VIAVLRLHPVADLVVDLRRQRLLLRQQLGDQAVARLHAARRGDHRKPFAPELSDAVIDALGDELAKLVLAHAGAVQEAPRLHVVDHVHHLEHQAGDLAQLRIADSRGEQEQVLYLRRLRDLLRHRVTEGGAQVVDRFVEDALQASPIERVIGLEETEAQVVIDLLFRLEVEAAPVDHRAAAQDEPHPLEVSERPQVGKWNGRLGDHRAAACCNHGPATSKLPPTSYVCKPPEPHTPCTASNVAACPHLRCGSG